MSRRIAFLSYYFPPLGGGGTPRSAKFVKYLPQHGYRPVVFTADASARREREFQDDATQASELEPREFDVIRIAEPAADASRWRLGWLNLHPLAWALAYPWLWERQRAWAARAADEIVRAGKKSSFDLIYASAAPNASIWAAAKAARALDVPFVADLRDLWTRDTLKFYPSRMHYLWESRLEKRLLGQAAAIVANTPGSAKRLAEWLGPSVADRIVTIPNGFDPDEFEQLADHDSSARGQITIVHAGTLYEPRLRRSRLGRFRPAALDDESRSVVPLARGIEALQRTNPSLAARLRVRLLGYTPASCRAAVESLGVADRFSFEGVLSREQAVEAIRQADALLVLQVAFADATRPVPYVPGKVYDYLAAGRPIVAPVPPGDLHDLMMQAPQAYVCSHRSGDEIAQTLTKLAADLDTGHIASANPQWLAQFSRPEQARCLARVFESVTRANAVSPVTDHPAVRTPAAVDSLA